MYFTFIFIYLIVLILIGILKTRGVKNQSDFALAGRSLTPWVLTGTMIATWIGTGSILGNAGKTYQTGIAALMIPLGSILGIILLVSISEKVRNMEITTVPEIIGNRFGNIARLLVTIALVMAYMVIVSYQYNAGGSILQVVLVDENNLPLLSMETAILISAVFIVTYTILAGLFSVAYTDVANSIIIIITFIISFPILWMKAGGFSGIETAFINSGRSSHMDIFGVFGPIDIINFCLPPFLLILGDANMYQRFSAGKSGASVKKATIIFIFGVLFVELLIIATAWVSSAMVTDIDNGRHIMIYAAKNILPPLIGAVMITTIVGIIISTADSYLLVPATTIVYDIYMKYFNRNSTSAHILAVNRICVLILGIIAFWVSKGFEKSEGFFERALYAYTIYGAGVTPSIMAALFWKRATTAGVITSIITGVFMTLIWKEWDLLRSILPMQSFALDEVLPAAVASIFMLIFVSLLTGKKNVVAN